MCGIIGYVGHQEVVPVVLEGLRRLEYRGYDSAGIAVVGPDGIDVRRSAGKLANLEAVLRERPLTGAYGIGHTRWATHGRPTEENAHPHRDQSGRVVLVHNGIIENYLELKRELQARGITFRTETDTEVVAHLVGLELAEDGLHAAVTRALQRLRGLFALVVVSSADPGTIVAVRNGPPVVVGLGEGEYFVASDIPAILAHTRDVVFLEDGQVAVLRADGVRFFDAAGQSVTRDAQRITWDPVMAEKAGYKHFMLKEIFEQPWAIKETLVGRLSMEQGDVHLPEINLDSATLAGAVACGAAGLRHVMACGAGGEVPHRATGARARGSGLRLGVSLPAADRLGVRSRGRDHAVGRDGRHPRRPARGPAPGRPQHRDLQRRRQHGDAGSRRARSRRMPGRRSAWRPPRPSRRSWWRWCCSRYASPAPAAR